MRVQDVVNNDHLNGRGISAHENQKEQWDSCEMFGVRQLAHNSDS